MKKYSLLSILICLLISCSSENSKAKFSYVKSSHSNINFTNTIVENDSVNVVMFQYVYNGGGVGIGDFNNDGLSDIVFTGNQVSSKMYINKGNFQFEDISENAQFKTSSWVTGVSIIDINTDGYEDIYLNVGGANCNNDCENLLFINQGLDANGFPTFKEQAAEYNLADGNYSQQTAFFDYDSDGDLDAFITRNGNVKFDKNSPVPKNYMPKNLADMLLRNDRKEGVNHPVFTDVSDSLGITYKGFSLGVNIQDFNGDNLPDIYVSNDFITEDLLYINQGNHPETNKHQGFTESNKQFLSHITYNAMGVDISDINNDALPDILVVDMLPESYDRQKRMLGVMNYDKYELSKRNNYNSQFMHNTLQLHNGMLNDSVLKASEVGYMSGMASTDWSWAPILADFDNDGDKDAYITNGYVKDLTDLDFINYSTQNTMFGSKESRTKRLRELLNKIPSVHLPNYFYENKGAIQFNDVSKDWKVAENSFSNGAAYADFDNDGDLDLVVNNINQEAFLLKNNTNTPETNNYLRIKLKGEVANAKAIGAKVTIWQNGNAQHQYQSVIRGYLSSMEPIVHFGVASNTAVDSLQVLWPNGKVSSMTNVAVNSVVEADIKSAFDKNISKNTTETIFTDVSNRLDFEHKENRGHDYVLQHLLMRQYSKFGPCIAAADVDNQPGDEVFIGGSKGEAATIWTQTSTGTFELLQELDSKHEDTDAVFVDIDNDNDLDLYVASGGTEVQRNAPVLQDRIYLNDGNGHFSQAENILPEIFEVSARVRPNDFDKNGDIDFFIGSRIVQGRYPQAPKSQLLTNTNGTFLATTNDALTNLGMITDATWQDINNDGWDDLIVVGEWLPITIFLNNNGTLEKSSPNFTNATNETVETFGWWNAIKAADFDNDGDLDFIVGNQGENGFVLPKENKPVYVYKNDYDNNGSTDPIVAQYFNDPENNNTLLPVQTRDDVMKQLVKLKDRYLTYKDFAKVSFTELLNIENLEEETFKATTFSSSYIENLGNGNYKITKLPEQCQVAPINDILLKDIDNDGFTDALLVGNDLTAETNYGLNDALIGVHLKGSKNGFEVVKNSASGFYVPGQSHHIVTLKSATGETMILASQNNTNAKIFLIKESEKK
ncbi:VCBS repeat-containing protein [uncultured Kordia sp.]|uniref:VCBS repeat-containing protein n=1 Tax=uncultured Kordia sp. TaxID=507699 RepID=UPI002610FBA0|nr:VCBS repeat-containing protein [uncultured Kordia sp.]